MNATAAWQQHPEVPVADMCWCTHPRLLCNVRSHVPFPASAMDPPEALAPVHVLDAPAPQALGGSTAAPLRLVSVAAEGSRAVWARDSIASGRCLVWQQAPWLLRHVGGTPCWHPPLPLLAVPLEALWNAAELLREARVSVLLDWDMAAFCMAKKGGASCLTWPVLQHALEEVAATAAKGVPHPFHTMECLVLGTQPPQVLFSGVCIRQTRAVQRREAVMNAFHLLWEAPTTLTGAPAPASAPPSAADGRVLLCQVRQEGAWAVDVSTWQGAWWRCSPSRCHTTWPVPCFMAPSPMLLRLPHALLTALLSTWPLHARHDEGQDAASTAASAFHAEPGMRIVPLPCCRGSLMQDSGDGFGPVHGAAWQRMMRVLVRQAHDDVATAAVTHRHG